MRTLRGLKAAVPVLSVAVLIGCAPGDEAIGFIVGAPTGLSYSRQLGGRRDFVLGLGLTDWGLGRFHLDWVEHKSRVAGGEWVTYWGVGVRFHLGTGAGNDFDVGPRVPIGLTHDFGSRQPYLFLEVAPGLELTDPSVTVDWALGLRFAF